MLKLIIIFQDLVEMVIELQAHVSAQNQQQKDLEEYLDNLLVRVMETSPRILQNPYSCLLYTSRCV